MRIRRNSKEFKQLKNQIDDLDGDRDLRKKVELYIVKAGERISRRIPINSKLADHRILFDLQWDVVKYSMLDRSYSLNRHDKIEGLYYFSASNDPDWDQSPFELKGKAKKELQEFF